MRRNPVQTRKVETGYWRWFVADEFGDPLLMSASAFLTREDAELDYNVMLPIIRKSLQ